MIVSAQVPVEVRNELVRRALADDRSLSSEVRRALASHLKAARAQDRGEA